MRAWTVFTLLAITFFGISGTSAVFVSQHSPSSNQWSTLINLLDGQNRFHNFLELLDSSNLFPKINTSLHFTVFAFPDSVFDGFPPNYIQALKADQVKLDALIGLHVILNTDYMFHGVVNQILTSSNFEHVRINEYNLLHINTAQGVNVTTMNQEVVHGHVHIIDGIMKAPVPILPQYLTTRPDLTKFDNLIIQENLQDFFKSDTTSTIFLPNNDAWAKLSPHVMEYLNTHSADLTEVLKYHMSKASTLYSIGMRNKLTIPSANVHHDQLMILQDGNGDFSIEHAQLIQIDISSETGVFHVIDHVLLPPRVLIAMETSGIVLG
ncbi:periostin-like [Physella acuta]|uniref:periostin-like n=1 Tax=Physella acuta TaxID=109671 RepID=UPI0027DACEEB|nr:periostin-like [Physella acuta]